MALQLFFGRAGEVVNNESVGGRDWGADNTNSDTFEHTFPLLLAATTQQMIQGLVLQQAEEAYEGMRKC